MSSLAELTSLEAALDADCTANCGADSEAD